MSDVHLYLVAYDIANIGNGPKRWRHVVKALKRRGRRVQLSVFLCRASTRAMGRLEARLRRRQIVGLEARRLATALAGGRKFAAWRAA